LYGTNWGGFKPIFANPTYLQVDDDSSSNEGYKEDTIERANAIDIGGFCNINDNDPLFLCLMMVLILMRQKDHLPPWSEPYFGYGIQWSKPPLNGRNQLMSNFVTMQYHVYELLHRRSKPFMWPKAMNYCTLTWFSIKWKMGWAIQLIASKVAMKLCCNMRIPARKGLGSRWVLYICRVKRNNIHCSMHFYCQLINVGKDLTILI
jgi:hypothetical protein